MNFTAEDIAHLRAEFRDLDGEPETCMTSVGYVDVHPTGEVVAHNVILLRFDEDGDVE
jgi:hypothetical protein